MPELDMDDALLREAFGDFRDAAMPHVTPAELGTLRLTVRRRRRAGVVFAAVALLAASAIPVAIWRTGPAAQHGDLLGPASPAAPRCPGSTGSSGLDLAVVATDILLGPVDAGPIRTWRRGEMTILICNLGGSSAPAGTMKLRWLATIPPASDVGDGAWRDCQYADHETEPLSGVDVNYYVVHCRYPEIPPGGSTAFTLDFYSLGDADAGFDRPAIHYAEVAAAGDVDPSNDRATFHIRTK
jgi:hypothetical protein